MLVVKKYPNRRLYDTESSQYMTLDELTRKIQAGREVRVIDAKSGGDLTQVTLAQIVLEGPGAKLLPVPLLAELIRMNEDLLSEFLSRYMVWALDAYLQMRRPMLGTVLGKGPFGLDFQDAFGSAMAPLAGTLASPFTSLPRWLMSRGKPAPEAVREPERASSSRDAETQAELATLRSELAKMRGSLRKRAPKKNAKAANTKRSR
jgi:polyhydroxyalkanoate synthesis repressor PhaR